jgi:hypothetical protein
MAQKVSVVLIDDMDGGEAGETVEFGLDGTSYEIDLSHRNSQELRDLLKPYIDKGRKVTVTARRPSRSRKSFAYALSMFTTGAVIVWQC